MMDRAQLIRYIIRPVLRRIPKGYSAEAELAIIMIIAHESKRGTFIKQVRGPAMGLIQMEHKTHETVWKYGGSVWKNALSLGIITFWQYCRRKHPESNRLIHDLKYNTFMARQRLFMKPEALPSADKPREISRYLKKHWNTIHGSADNESYFDDWKLWR